MKKRNKKFILIGFLILGVIFSYSELYREMNTLSLREAKFDRAMWLAQYKSMDPDNPRGPMYGDLKENYLILGMKKEDVKKLLGEPDFGTMENCMVYNLGMWSGFQIDYDSLDICFDYNDNLNSAYHVQH